MSRQPIRSPERSVRADRRTLAGALPGACGPRWAAITNGRAKIDSQRRKLLDAYYANAIDVATLKAEQDRLGRDAQTVQDRLAALDANLEEARQVLDTAIAFAADCATAYAKASDTTRKRFNDAVFTRIDVRDGHVTGWEAHPLYAELFDGPGFEYGSLVEVMPQHTNTSTVPGWWIKLGGMKRRGTYDVVREAVERLAASGSEIVTVAEVREHLESDGVSVQDNTLYRTLYRLCDPVRFDPPPVVRVGRGRFQLASSGRSSTTVRA